MVNVLNVEQIPKRKLKLLFKFKEDNNMSKNIDWKKIINDIDKRSEGKKDITIHSSDLGLDRDTGQLKGINDNVEKRGHPMTN